MSKQSREVILRTLNYLDQFASILETSDEYRALVALKKLVKEHKKLKKYVDEVISITGTDNIGNAIKRLKSDPMGGSVPEILPPELTVIPKIWFEGIPKNKNHPQGVARLSLFQAKRELERLTPHMRDAWKYTDYVDNGEEIREDILEKFQELPYSDFATFCYCLVHQYDLMLSDEEQQKPELLEANYGDIHDIVFRPNTNNKYGVQTND